MMKTLYQVGEQSQKAIPVFVQKWKCFGEFATKNGRFLTSRFSWQEIVGSKKSPNGCEKV